MKKRAAAVALLAGILLCLTGCLEATSLERYGYVDAIGIDIGEEMDYKVTFVLQMVDVQSNATKSAGFELVSAECNSIFEAIDAITSQLPYQLNFARTSMFLLSQEVASQEGAVEKLMNAMISKLQIRYNASVFIALGNAHDILAGLKNKFDPNITQILTNFVSYSKQTGLVPVANLDLLVAAMDTKTYDALLPLCGLSKENAEKKSQDSIGEREYAYIGGSLLVESDMKTGLCGSALMSGGKMVGILDGQHTQLLLMATGAYREGRCTITLPDEKELEVHLEMSHPPTGTFRLGDQPSSEISMLIVAEIEMPEYLPDHSTEELEEMIAEQVESDLNTLFEGVRRLNADPFGFGRKAVMEFSDVEKWEEYDWTNAYQKLSVGFHARVELVQSTQKSILE